MWTSNCHREAAWQTVVYRESVPINPDGAGHANIYPEGGRSFCCSTVKMQLISLDFSKSRERQCEHCALEDGFKVNQGCVLQLRQVSRRQRHCYRGHLIPRVVCNYPCLQLEYKGGPRISSCALCWHPGLLLLCHFQKFQSTAFPLCVRGCRSRKPIRNC